MRFSWLPKPRVLDTYLKNYYWFFKTKKPSTSFFRKASKGAAQTNSLLDKLVDKPNAS